MTIGGRVVARVSVVSLLASAALAAYIVVAPPRATFDLIVRDEAGAGVGGARVSLVATRRPFGLQQNEAFEVESFDDGRARFDDVPFGTLRVRIEKAGFAEYAVSYPHLGEAGAEVRLNRANVSDALSGLEVIVTDQDDVPVESATVVATGERLGRAFRFESVSDPRGRALFPYATAGLVLLSVRRDSFTPFDVSYVVGSQDRVGVKLTR